MFSLSCIRENAEVGCAWSLPGHVFVGSRDRQRLSSMDTKPVTFTMLGRADEAVLVTKAAASIQDLLFVRGDPHRVMVIYSDSVAECWAFSLESYRWSCQGKVTLSENTHCHLVSVVLHQHHNAIYWCEGKPGEKFACSVFYRSLPKDTGCWQNVEFGPPVGLLEQCPSSVVLEAADSLVIWPNTASWPPGVFLKWLPSIFSLQVVIRGSSLAIKEKKYSKLLDFHALMVKTLSAWQQAKPLTSWIRVHNPQERTLLFLDEEAWIQNISDKPEIKPLQKLPVDASAVLWCLQLHQFYITSTKEEIKVSGARSCQLLQSLSLGGIQGVWTSHSTLYIAGVYTHTAVYQLELNPSAIVASMEEAASTLHHLTPHKRALLALSELYASCKGGQCPEVCDHLSMVLDGRLFQSSALLLALLHQVSANGGSSEIRRVLYETAKSSGIESTKLTAGLAPLIESYWDLEEKKKNLLKVENTKPLPAEHLRQEIHWVLVTANWLPLATRQALLGLLIARSSHDVLRLLLEDLGITEVEGTEEEAASQTAGRLWSAILFPVFSSNAVPRKKQAGDLRLFKLLTQICFMLEPKQLKTLVVCAIHVLDANTGAHTFLDVSSKSLVCQQVLEALPRPSQSCSSKAAAIATAWLHTESNTPQCELDALSCLLQYGLWSEGIQLVCIMAGGDKHHEVYQLLVQTAVKEKKLPEYCSAILDLAPEDTSAEDVLDHIAHLYVGDQEEQPTVFATKANRDIPLRLLRAKFVAEHEETYM